MDRLDGEESLDTLRCLVCGTGCLRLGGLAYQPATRVCEGDLNLAARGVSVRTCTVGQGLTRFPVSRVAHSLTWQLFYRLQACQAASVESSRPLWRAHEQRVARASAQRRARPMVVLNSRLLCASTWAAAGAGGAGSRDGRDVQSSGGMGCCLVQHARCMQNACWHRYGCGWFAGGVHVRAC